MGITDRIRQAFGIRHESRSPVLSFGTWSEFPSDEPRVVQVCHPDWRGIRAAAYAFESPVVEVDDLGTWGPGLVSTLVENEIEVIVIQGWPPGAERFVETCSRAGLVVKCLLHSSPALQGDSVSEARVIGDALSLLRDGFLDELGTVKAGVVEAFAAIGLSLSYVPNRAPRLGEVRRHKLGSGVHVGVFGEPWWPKNISTQVLGALMIPNATVHISKRLLIDYLPEDRVVVHGELSRNEFLTLLGSVDLNLYATFTECHPIQPIESYLLGVPCLIASNSMLFRDDPELFRLTAVGAPDEPTAIAMAARRLLTAQAQAVAKARDWIIAKDLEASETWAEFTHS